MRKILLKFSNRSHFCFRDLAVRNFDCFLQRAKAEFPALHIASYSKLAPIIVARERSFWRARRALRAVEPTQTGAEHAEMDDADGYDGLGKQNSQVGGRRVNGGALGADLVDKGANSQHVGVEADRVHKAVGPNVSGADFTFSQRIFLRERIATAELPAGEKAARRLVDLHSPIEASDLAPIVEQKRQVA